MLPNLWGVAAVLCTGAAVAVATTGFANPGKAGAPNIKGGAPNIHVVGTPLGHTGGFGERSCIVCHLEFELNPAGSVLKVAGFPPTYELGHTYELTIELEGEGMLKGGFQATIRFADGVQAGELRAGNGRVIVTDSADVAYAGHAQSAVEVTHPDRISWALYWVAPSEPRDVVLHVAANSANGDNSPLGDWVLATAKHSTPEGDYRR